MYRHFFDLTGYDRRSNRPRFYLWGGALLWSVSDTNWHRATKCVSDFYANTYLNYWFRLSVPHIPHYILCIYTAHVCTYIKTNIISCMMMGSRRSCAATCSQTSSTALIDHVRSRGSAAYITFDNSSLSEPIKWRDRANARAHPFNVYYYVCLTYRIYIGNYIVHSNVNSYYIYICYFLMKVRR